MILAKVNPCIPTYYDKEGKRYWKIADVINPICLYGKGE